MSKWFSGRQGGGYEKLPLFISQRFKFDLYIIKIPEGTEISKHTDPVTPGYNHHRANFTFFGRPKQMYVAGPIKRWWRFEYFRPDLYSHGLKGQREDIWMISLGWLTKA